MARQGAGEIPGALHGYGASASTEDDHVLWSGDTAWWRVFACLSEANPMTIA